MFRRARKVLSNLRLLGGFAETRPSGQAAVELALAVPVLILFVLAGSDYARVFFVSVEVNNAARAGASYGIQSVSKAQDLTGMQTAAVNDGSNISGLTATATQYCICSNHAKFTCGSSPACQDQAMYVQVTTTATFHTYFSYPGIPNTITLNGSAIMRAQ